MQGRDDALYKLCSQSVKVNMGIITRSKQSYQDDFQHNNGKIELQFPLMTIGHQFIGKLPVTCQLLVDDHLVSYPVNQYLEFQIIGFLSFQRQVFCYQVLNNSH